MNVMKPPKTVEFDVVNLTKPNKRRLIRLGVLTAVAIEDDTLRIRGGIGQGGDHDTLASTVAPGSDRFMELPPYMASQYGAVVGWREPKRAGDFGVVFGQKPRETREGTELDYDQTNECLRLAALALGIVLKKPWWQMYRLPGAKPLVLPTSVLNSRAAQNVQNHIHRGG